MCTRNKIVYRDGQLLPENDTAIFSNCGAVNLTNAEVC